MMDVARPAPDPNLNVILEERLVGVHLKGLCPKIQWRFVRTC